MKKTFINPFTIVLGTFVLISTIAILLYSYQPQFAGANPSEFCRDSVSSTFASTSVTYITAGRATTTLTFTNCNNKIYSTDSAVVLGIFQASTTAPQIKTRVEFSPNNIDWYPDNSSFYVPATAINIASTTVQTTPFHENLFVLSTTTDNGGTGLSNQVYFSLNVPTPTKFTRVIFYMPTGGGEGSLYAEAEGKAQRQ